MAISHQQIRRKLRRPIENALLRSWMALGPRLSRPATVRLARLMGRCAYAFSKRQRIVGWMNLHHVYGDTLTDAEKKRILHASFFHFSLTILDIFWFNRNTRKRIAEYVHADEGVEILAQGKPVVCLTAHYGNWEILGQKMVCMGFPLASVAQTLVNPYADARFIQMREALGQEIVPKNGAIRRLFKILRDGGNVALVMDQNISPKLGGIFLDFFGLPAPSSPAPASLGLKTGALFGFGFCSSDPQGHYHITIYQGLGAPPNSGDLEKDISELTQRILHRIQDHIREHPEPWLWTYKRWRHVLPGDDIARYPAYAKEMWDADFNPVKAQQRP